MKKPLKKLLKDSDTIIKLVTREVVTALVNILQMGPRIIFRSTVQLLRANLLTRVLSCITILIIDIYDLIRRRISKKQFICNVILSVLLIITGTIGWNMGGLWLAFEFLGGFADIIGSIIGAGITVFLSNFVFDKTCNILIESDAKSMLKIIDPYIEKLPEEKRLLVKKQITGSCLKKMFASEDKEAFAENLVNISCDMLPPP